MFELIRVHFRFPIEHSTSIGKNMHTHSPTSNKLPGLFKHIPQDLRMKPGPGTMRETVI